MTCLQPEHQNGVGALAGGRIDDIEGKLSP